MKSRGSAAPKRDTQIGVDHPLRLPARDEDGLHATRSLLSLSIAVSSAASPEAGSGSVENGCQFASRSASDASAVPPGVRKVPAKTARRLAKQAGVEPDFGNREEAMASRATATATAKKPASGRRTASGPKDSALERRDRVVMEHLPLVKAIAVRVHEGLPVHVELEDLVHAGILGLFDAASRYNPNRKVSFSSYAKHRIKGAILDSLRQMDWASRDLRRRHRQVEQATRDLCAMLHRQPTEDELAERLGVGLTRWRQMALDLRSAGLVSASTRSQDQEELPPPDYPGAPEWQPDQMCARQQMKHRLMEAMRTLPERYRKVVVLYYGNELTMKEIGGILGINESRVSQIHKSALEKMAAVLQQSGITSSNSF